MLRRGFSLLIFLFAAGAVFAQTGPQRRRPRTRSHRSRPRPIVPQPLIPEKPRLPEEPSAETAARPAILSRPLPKTRRLSKGRWKPSVADALERILEHSGAGDPDYSEADPPVAVFSFEDVAVNGHLGEAVFQRMVRKVDFRFNEAFWKRIPEQYGRARIRAGYEGFKNAKRENLSVDPYYRMYRKGMLRTYRSVCETAGFPACRRWIASLLMGYGERELRLYSRETLIEELNRPVGYESVGDTPEDPAPERERTGIRIIPEMRDLFLKLEQRGFDLWILSTSNDWSAKVFGTALGIHPSRVVGIRVKVDDGFLGEEPLIPIPTGNGAAEAMTLFVGRAPVLAMAAPEDEELLSYGPGTRVAVLRTRLDDETARQWRLRGWLSQPAFSPVRAPQRLFGPSPSP